MKKSIFLFIAFLFLIITPVSALQENEVYEQLKRNGIDDKIELYYNDVLVLNRNGKLGVIKYSGTYDNSNLLTVNYEYDKVEKITEKTGNYSEKVFYKTTKNNQHGGYDSLGDLICPPAYDDIKLAWDKNDNYAREIFVVSKGNKKGALRRKEQNYIFAVPIMFDDISLGAQNNSEYYIVVTQNEKKGMYISTDRSTGLVTIPAVFDEITIPNVPFIVVKQFGKYGVYNWNSQIVPIIYDKVTPSGRSIIVTQNNQQGAYHDGILTVPVGYDEVREADAILSFSNTDEPKYIVKKSNTYGVYNLVPREFNSIETVHRGFITEKNGKFGLYHITKGKLLNPEYDKIYSTSNTKLACEKNGKVVKEIDMNMLSVREKTEESFMKILFFPLFIGTLGLH